MSCLNISPKRNTIDISMNGGEYTDYLTAKELGEKWGITAHMVNCHCAAGHIPGAVKKADLWLTTADAEKPIDGREMAIINKNRCMYEYFFIGR